jgi:hypothetical protein
MEKKAKKYRLINPADDNLLPVNLHLCMREWDAEINEIDISEDAKKVHLKFLAEKYSLDILGYSKIGKELYFIVISPKKEI